MRSVRFLPVCALVSALLVVPAGASWGVAAPQVSASLAGSAHAAAAAQPVPFVVSASATRRVVVPGKTTQLSGRVVPAARGQRVILEVRARGAWRAVGSTVLSKTSTFHFSWKVGGIGGHFVRIVKPAAHGHAEGVSPTLEMVGTGRKSVKSTGSPLRLSLGGVSVSTPNGAIRPGQSLTISVGSNVTGFGAEGASSVLGGPYLLSTSQGEPSKPVAVTVSYDPGLVSPGSKPVVLHGSTSLKRWIPEPTAVNTARHTMSATLTSFSPIDGVDDATWLFGDLTGNRTDLPDDCGATPSWVTDTNFLYARNDPLPACISKRSDGQTLYLNVVNNRGYTQVVHITNAKVDVGRSIFSDSIAGAEANALARLETDVANGFATATANSADSMVLIPATGSVTLAIARPPTQVGAQTVSIDASPQGTSAAGALAWAFLNQALLTAAAPSDITNCIVGEIYNTISTSTAPATILDHLHSCVDSALSLKSKDAKVVQLKGVLDKIAVAAFTVSFFYKLVDINVDTLYPPHYSYDIPGLGTDDKNLKISSTNLGAITAGSTTVKQLTVTGGTAPYRFEIWNEPDNVANVPFWASLSSGGTLTLSPGSGADAGTYGFDVFVVDAAGRHSGYAASPVSFTVVAAPSLTTTVTSTTYNDQGLVVSYSPPTGRTGIIDYVCRVSFDDGASSYPCYTSADSRLGGMGTSNPAVVSGTAAVPENDYNTPPIEPGWKISMAAVTANGQDPFGPWATITSPLQAPTLHSATIVGGNIQISFSPAPTVNGLTVREYDCHLGHTVGNVTYNYDCAVNGKGGIGLTSPATISSNQGGEQVSTGWAIYIYAVTSTVTSPVTPFIRIT